MIDPGKPILKPDLKDGDALVDTSSHTIFKVTGVKLNRRWSHHCIDLESPITGEKRGLWLFLLVGEHSRYHKL